MNTAAIDPIRIRDRAYARWLSRGCPHGSAEKDWFEAEAELSRDAARVGPPPTPSAPRTEVSTAPTPRAKTTRRKATRSATKTPSDKRTKNATASTSGEKTKRAKSSRSTANRADADTRS